MALLMVHVPEHCVNVGNATTVGAVPVLTRVVAPTMVVCVGVVVVTARPVTVNGWPEAVIVYVPQFGPWHAAIVVRIGAMTVEVKIVVDVMVVGVHVSDT